MKRILTVATVLAALSGGVVIDANAQTWGNPVQSGSGAPSQSFIDRLNALIDKGEQQRLADPGFLYELRSLARAQQYPWGKRILDDSFSDGNYTANPTWVASGDVRADWNGVRLTFIPRAETTQTQQQSSGGNGGKDLALQAFGAFLNKQLNKNNNTQTQTQTAQPPAPDQAAIRTQAIISNTFALQVEVTSHGPVGAERRLEIGPYQSASATDGYRLVYSVVNQTPQLEILRIGSRGSAIVESVQKAPALEDGKSHLIEWRRQTDGTMTVSVDNQMVMQTRDQGFKSPFNGLTLSNKAGDYTFRRITLDGV